ncbi:MAG: M13 family peptidase, partial [Acidobacteria bacterium]|nr:M13 family peptidase [Acidobacteriota bacterium]
MFNRMLSILGLLALACTGPVQAQGSEGIIIAADIDRSVKPGDDFYRFANGSWLKRVELPPDRASVSIFSVLMDLSNRRMTELLAPAAGASAPAGSGQRKIRDLYQSYMDEAGIEAKGLEPIKAHLAEIAAISDKHQLARALGATLRADVDALNNTNFHTPNLFGVWVAPDFNDPSHYGAYLLQGGLELPDREYYLGGTEP